MDKIELTFGNLWFQALIKASGPKIFLSVYEFSVYLSFIGSKHRFPEEFKVLAFLAPPTEAKLKGPIKAIERGLKIPGKISF